MIGKFESRNSNNSFGGAEVQEGWIKACCIVYLSVKRLVVQIHAGGKHFQKNIYKINGGLLSSSPDFNWPHFQIILIYIGVWACPHAGATAAAVQNFVTNNTNLPNKISSQL